MRIFLFIRDKILFIIKKIFLNKIESNDVDSKIVDVMERNKSLTYKNITMLFSVPNKICEYRIKTFATKEPETLDWIDSLPENSVLWDIGANIGLYSVYAAMKKHCRVYCFEPSFFNLELLARNIFLNGLDEKITILPFPLSDTMGENKLLMSSTDWGGACSTFGRNVGWDGDLIKDNFSYRIVGLSMDQVVSILQLPMPEFIKMDVDGIEHYILKGGNNILKNIKGILIEINDDFEEQSQTSKKILENSGFSMVKKLHAEWSNNTILENCYNQIWERF